MAYRIERTLWIDAPRERVWSAITQADLIQRWFSPATPWVVTALEPGGKMCAVGYEAQGSTIEVVDPPREFSYRWALDARGFLTAYTLTEENGGTRVTLTETGVEPPHADMDNAKGWGMALDNLKAYLEGRDLPYPEGL
jgi:uncharacterized protein YndB with AHSA1/START domain